MARKKSERTDVITSIKGFDSNLRCRGYQFEIGKTYTVEGKIKACENGFHTCPVEEHPLSVFDYYPPAGARYCEVEQSGESDRDGVKLASASITIKAEISIGDLIARAIKYVFDRAKPEEGASATGDRGAASATGDYGAASATGNYGAAMAAGYEGRVSGAQGNALFLVERNDNYEIINVWAGIAGQDGIKENTFYTLKGGKPVEVE